MQWFNVILTGAELSYLVSVDCYSTHCDIVSLSVAGTLYVCGDGFLLWSYFLMLACILIR